MRTSKTAQALLDLMLRVPAAPGHPLAKLAFALLAVLRRAAVALLGDPRVAYTLDGTRLLLPLSHELPLIRRRLPDYSRNIGRIAAALAAKHPDMTMVDIGANIGDTVAIVRRHARFPILCIDGDAFFHSLLVENTRDLGDVRHANVYIGEASTTVQATTARHGGTGGMTTDAAGTSTIQTRSLASVLADDPAFRAPTLVKIDTDGFDTRIVKGAIDFLAATQPVVFMEYDPHLFAANDPDGFGVFAALRGAGYTDALFFENTGGFLARVRLDDAETLADLHAYYSGRGGHAYCDVCVFPASGADVMQAVRRGELDAAAARGR
jgi:FkbM family methyltransferase